MKNINTNVNKQQQQQQYNMHQGKNNTQSSKLQQRNANKTRHRIKPAELYRTDFITAMKLPDNEVLDDEAYWLIRDPWKLDWEKGVQVPIKPNELNNPNYKLNPIESTASSTTTVNRSLRQQINFKLPKKYLCPANDPHFDVNIHEAYITHRLVDNICRYDSDDLDVCWLNRINLEFQLMGIEQLTRTNFERIIESFETQTYENLKEAIRTLESYSIEYDDEVVCDVCRSPDSEDTNEMVFCDGCNLCVHQACYGIDKIPKGSWLCAPCQLTVKPQCILCPNSGGAMKSTRNLRNWCHVSCALWVPEVGFGNPDKMEPIVNINKIPAARWQLICHLCKEKRGCCFQCSEKKCHSAFHITCAFKHNLEMQTILGHKEDDIVFKAYCLKHSKKRQRYTSINNRSINEYIEPQQPQQQQQQIQTPLKTTTATTTINNNHSPSSVNSLNTDLCKLNEQDRKLETEKRIAKLDLEFYKYANIDFTFDRLKLNRIHLDYVFNYWKLKRRLNKQQNKPLLIPKADEDLMNQSERLLNARIKMFIHLRQDLERVRNLCYMVIKREKLKKKYFQLKTNIFYKQCEFIQKYGVERSGRTKDILLTNHQNCIYDYLIQSPNDSCNSGKKYVLDNDDNDTDDIFVDVDEHQPHPQQLNLDLIIKNEFNSSSNEQQQDRLEKEIAELRRQHLTTTTTETETLSVDNECNISNISPTGTSGTGTGGGIKRKSPLISKTQQQQQKKNLITNQIKSKYKNIQMNNYLTQQQQQQQQYKSPPMIKNGFNNNNNKKDENDEKFKLIDNDLKLTPNGFLKCSNKNKKFKLTPSPSSSSSAATTTTTNGRLRNSNNISSRFSLRNRTSKTTSSRSNANTNSNTSTTTTTAAGLNFENNSY